MISKVNNSLLLVKLEGIKFQDFFKNKCNIGLLVQFCMIDVGYKQKYQGESVETSLISFMQIFALQQKFESENNIMKRWNGLKPTINCLG